MGKEKKNGVQGWTVRVDEAGFLRGGKKRTKSREAWSTFCGAAVVSLMENRPSLDVFSPAVNDSVLIHSHVFLKQKRTSLNC